VSRRTTLRRAAFASSVVASMPTDVPFTKPASPNRWSIQVKTASCVSRSIRRRRAGNRRMIRRRLRPHQGIGRPPGARALGVQPLEVADQRQLKIVPGWQPWPTVVRIEALAQSLDVSVEAIVSTTRGCSERTCVNSASARRPGIDQPDAARRLRLVEDERVADNRGAVGGRAPLSPRIVQVLHEKWLP